MQGESIFGIACEMLQKTNVFNKEISEIGFTDQHGKKIRLIDLVKKETGKYNHRFRGWSEQNMQCAYEAIANAMPKYLDSGYSAPFSFKQRTKVNFETWLKNISYEYDILNPFVPEALNAKENHVGIAMVKLLHCREGITYSDIENKLDISDRSAQKNLVKLNPTLYNGPKEPYAPFCIGGQPLCANVELIDPKETDASQKRFWTRNSVHPLVLQENIMQLATLLNALCHQYFDREDQLSVLIAVDIWNQMSEYAQKKILTYFTHGNEDLKQFVLMLKQECPDDHVCMYHTEREMLKEIEMSIDQALEFLIKESRSRSGTILLSDGTCLKNCHVCPNIGRDGRECYEATDECGEKYIITKEQISEIILL